MNKIKKFITRVLTSFFVFMFLLAPINAAATDTQVILHDTVTISTAIASNGATFTSFTRSIDTMEHTRVESTGYYRIVATGGTGDEWYFAEKDSQFLDYALISRQAPPTTAGRWYRVVSLHVIDGWYYDGSTIASI